MNRSDIMKSAWKKFRVIRDEPRLTRMLFAKCLREAWSRALHIEALRAQDPAILRNRIGFIHDQLTLMPYKGGNTVMQERELREELKTLEEALS